MNGLPATVVTGAATGMGRALCERLAARGEPVVAVDLNDEVQSWPKSHESVVPLVADIATEEGNRSMVDLALDRFGAVGGAALNAGVCLPGGIDTMPLEQFDLMWGVNLRGMVLGIRAVLPALRANGGGAVVATASIGGLVGDPSMWAYNATKAAIISVIKSVALEIGHEGIRVNAVCPGPTRDTGMSAGMDERPTPPLRHPGPGDSAQALGHRPGDGRGDGLPPVAGRGLHHRHHHRRRWRHHRRPGAPQPQVGRSGHAPFSRRREAH